MRIKKIEINGIRGLAYRKDSPHIIDLLNYRHLFLYGENGTGKSSFFDALEWGLTGEIEESKARKVEKNDILRNKFSEEQDRPYVKILYKNRDQEEKVFIRFLNGKDTFELEEIVSDNFIDAKRIENFVIDTRKSLWNRFVNLLGFEDLILFEKRLIRLKNEAKRKYEESEKIFNNKRKEIEDLESKKQQLETEFEEKLGKDWGSLLRSKEKEKVTEKFSDLENLNKAINYYLQSVEEKHELNSELEELEKKLKRIESTLSEAAISKIIEEAYNYFKETQEIDKCPVCGQPIRYKDVLNRLAGLRQRLNEAIQFNNKIKNLEDDIDNKDKKIKEYNSNIEKLYLKLYDSEIKVEESENALQMLSSKKGEIEKEIEQLRDIIQLLESWGRYKEIVDAVRKGQENLENLSDEKNLKKKIWKDVRNFYVKYKEKYSETISNELIRISKEKVTEIYNKINQSDNEVVESFIIEPDVEKTEITFQAKIRGREEMINAISFLSTAHLRCLGFALLISRMQIHSNQIGFIAIDDPIYSVDHEHRYFLIKYLKELGNDYQLIITTSDRIFYDLIRHQFNSNSCVAYKTYLGSYSSPVNNEVVLGVEIKSSPQNYIEEAEKHLNHKDLRAASLYSRLALETVLFTVAEKVNLKIPYKRINKLGVRALMHQGLKEKLKKEYGCDNDIDKQFQNLSDHRYFRALLSQSKGYPLDEEVHFPHEERASYTVEEVKEVIETLKVFIDFLTRLLE